MTDTALSQPLYGASFGQAVKRFFSKYAVFSGRASRSEFWWVWLFLLLLSLVLAGIAGTVIGLTGTPTASGDGVQITAPGIVALVVVGLILLAFIIPEIALTVRRLHDANFSGWLYLLHLIPYLGALIVFILTLLPTNPQGARFDR
ncbi:DUF805 domain-containing protein [Schumannella luteola]